jgi:hypothetical protein
LFFKVPGPESLSPKVRRSFPLHPTWEDFHPAGAVLSPEITAQSKSDFAQWPIWRIHAFKGHLHRPGGNKNCRKPGQKSEREHDWRIESHQKGWLNLGKKTCLQIVLQLNSLRNPNIAQYPNIARSSNL